MSRKRPAMHAAFLAVLRAAASHQYSMTRTKVAKLLYLADLRAVESGLRPFTGIEWKWHHYGPFSNDLLTVERNLSLSGEVHRKTVPNFFGSPEHRLRYSAEDDVLDLEKRFWDIIEAVVAQFGHESPTQLRDVTYQTTPMETAQEGGVRGVTLDLDEVRPLPNPAAAMGRLRRARQQLGRQSDDPGAFEEIREENDALNLVRRKATSRMLEG